MLDLCSDSEDEVEMSQKSPFVRHGGGAACGLDKDQRFEWAVTQAHTPKYERTRLSTTK